MWEVFDAQGRVLWKALSRSHAEWWRDRNAPGAEIRQVPHPDPDEDLLSLEPQRTPRTPRRSRSAPWEVFDTETGEVLHRAINQAAADAWRWQRRPPGASWGIRAKGSSGLGAGPEESKRSRSGFTYGYQWLGESPPMLRFPVELRAGEQALLFYPCIWPSRRFIIVETQGERDEETPRWAVLSMEEFERSFSDTPAHAQVLVAMDWHAENYEVTSPYWLKGEQYVLGENDGPPPSVRAWMEKAQHDAIWPIPPPEPHAGHVWWLDERIPVAALQHMPRTRTRWDELLERLGEDDDPRYGVSSLDVWGNPRDGYEVNNYFDQGTITVHESQDEDVLAALVREGHLQAEAVSRGRVEVEGSPGDAVEIMESENRPEMPEYAGDLPVGGEVWDWMWHATMDREFGDNNNGDKPPTEQDLIEHFPTLKGEVSKSEWPDYVDLMMEAFNAALEASRHEDTSGRPLLLVTRVDSELEHGFTTYIDERNLS